MDMLNCGISNYWCEVALDMWQKQKLQTFRSKISFEAYVGEAEVESANTLISD